MVKAYAVNWSEAWLIPDDEPKEGHYVKYEDYARLLSVSRSLLGLIADDAMLPNDFVSELSALGVLDDD